jgi:hypothetical protein
VAIRATLYTLSIDLLITHYGSFKNPIYLLVQDPKKMEDAIKEQFFIESFEPDTLTESVALTFGGHEVKDIDTKLKIVELHDSMKAWEKFITEPENSKKLIRSLTQAYLKIFDQNWAKQEQTLAPELQNELNASLDRMTQKLKQKLKEKGFDLPELK